MWRFLVLIVLSILFSSKNAKELQIEQITDQDLLNLIKTEKYVVTLFSKFCSSFIINKVIKESIYLLPTILHENNYVIKYRSLSN